MIEIKGKKVLLLGLGLHGGGVAAAKWLSKHGADLIISDLKTRERLAASLIKLRPLVRKYKNIRFVLGEHREQDVKWSDIIVYNPGVPRESRYLELGRKLGKLIVNEATLFFDKCPATIIGVTGTRGKSTTTALIGAMLKMDSIAPHSIGEWGLQNDKRRVVVAGNIRDTAMLDALDKIKRDDIVVLELSSWQLEGLGIIKKSPHIAVVTNLYPDHLNRYKRLADYYNSKKEIWRYQNKDDFLVLNGRDKVLRSWAKQAKSRVVFFHKVAPQPSFPRPLVPAKAGRESSFGEHNLENLSAAATVAGLLGVKDAAIKKALAKPLVLTGRQEIIAQKGGTTFVNDTCATSPQAGLAALKRFGEVSYRHPEPSRSAQGMLVSGSKKIRKKILKPLKQVQGQNDGDKRIILIAGGVDKNLKYNEWAAAARKYCREVYLLTGQASDKMAKALSGFKHAHGGYNNLRDILKEARAMSRPGDIILFSPSAASFNLWSHEFERGEDFVKQVKGLKN